MGFRRKTTETAVPETKAVAKDVPVKKSSGGGKQYHNEVLTIFRRENGELFVTVDQKKAEGLKIQVNGKEVTAIYTNDVISELEKSVDSGKLSEEKAQEIANRMQNIQTKNGDTIAVVSKITLVTEG